MSAESFRYRWDLPKGSAEVMD
jgi:hypothetical protein